MKNIWTLFACILTSSVSFAQPTFSIDKEKFVKEFQKTLSDYGKGDYNELTRKQLPFLLLESGNFPEELFVKLASTSNLILEKKLKPYPELYNYVYSIVSLFKNGQNEKSFKAWHVTIDQMLASRNVKRFEDFVELTAGFFDKQIITASSNFTWFYEGGTYSFDFIESPIIKFENGNLICRVENRDNKMSRKNPYIDSIVVLGTNGSFDPLLKRFVGKGGVINWEKVGLSKNETFATLSKYEVALKSSNFSADSVTLRTPYFSQPISGQVIERAFIINREEDRVYPQFNSYSRDLFISSLRKDLNFRGGVSLKGAGFEGIGTVENPATVTLFKKGQPFIISRSQLFFVNSDRIFSGKAEINLKFADNDSITHPGAEFFYEPVKENIELRRTKQGIGQAPFGNSYHQLDMYVPKIIWQVGSDTLRISYEYGMSQEQRIARLESKNYFDLRLYDQLQGLSSMHPLVAITSYAQKNGRFNLNDGKLATAMGKTIDQARITLFELANLGFITYDQENNVVDVNQKTINFAEARSNQRDYDNIAFISDFRPKQLKQYTAEEIKKDETLAAIQDSYMKMNRERASLKDFGTINLKTLEIKMVGVDEVKISDEQITSVFPRGNKVTILENRDFIFQGFINAGKLDINVEEGDFVYDEFKFKIAKSLNTRLNVKPLKPEDGNKAITLFSELSGITGEIYVDDPNNRSGRDKKVLGYPKIKSDKPSFIYYNSPKIYKGAYDSTRFYYTLEPFIIDSLDNFVEKALFLNGELTSAGIFPKFKQSLLILPDYSLGFITTAPTTGFDFYGKEAKYENKIALTAKGLQGSGTIKYLNSESISKNFAFLPDSTLGFIEFKNKQAETGIQFPEVYGKDVYMTYIPQENKLKVTSDLKNDLDFFKGQAKLKGTAILTPTGMEGKGLMNFTNATLISENFKYKCYDILGEEASFNLRNNNIAENEDKVAFSTKNVSANISFKDRKGEFKSNSGSAEMDFPVNQFKCRMDQFTWFMDQDQIEMESKSKDVAFDSGLDVIAPNFFSTNNRRDTLAFKAPKAKFSLEEKTIYCDEVEYVDVADARVFPIDKKITIRKKAKLDPLSNASILANYVTKYHRFEKASVDIISRKLYTASGEYPYYDIDSTVTYVKMAKIGLDTSNQTVANGLIGQEMNFKLSKEFAFYGEVKIIASQPYAFFKGATKIQHECEKFDRSWLAFETPINPLDIQIPVLERMTNLEGEKISAGIVWRNSMNMDSIRLYPTFLSSLVSQDDPIVLSSSGLIRYDKTKKEYQIASKNKFLNPSEVTNILTLNTKTCSMTGSGEVDLGMQFGELKTRAYGDVAYDQKTGVVDMELTLKVKMDLDKKLFEDAGLRIAATVGIEPMDLATVNLEKALVSWSDQKTADKFKSDYTIKGDVKKMPDPLEDGLVFSGIKLRSFEKIEFQERGLITSKKTAVLVNAFGQPVFRNIDFEAFFMQTYSEVSNDKFMMFYGLSGSKIYYLDYTMQDRDGELKMISSDKEFVTAVNAIKEEKRKSKNFTYEITDQKIYIARFNRLLGRRDE